MGVTFAHLFLITALSSSTLGETVTTGESPGSEGTREDKQVEWMGPVESSVSPEHRDEIHGSETITPSKNAELVPSDKLVDLPAIRRAETSPTQLWDPDPVAIRRPLVP